MTDETAKKLGDMLPTVEKEYAQFSAEYDRLRASYDELQAKVSPLEVQMREIEAKMDRMKQRLAGLNASMPAVRTLLTTMGS